MTYSTPNEVWNNLGKDAFTKVRSEIVGTGNAITSAWSLDHDNLIQSTLILYTNSTIVPTASFTIDLYGGEITCLTASASLIISDDYSLADIPNSTIL